MKRIIDVEKDYYELIKYNVEHGQKYKPFEIIANSTPYEEKPQVEQEVKLVPMAKVTFDEEKLREILNKEVIDKIKSGELVLQTEDSWIPISERLPGEFQRILVSIVNYRGEKVVRVAEYYHRGKGVFQIKENREQWEVGEKGLLAWMPLPEPYKEGDEE